MIKSLIFKIYFAYTFSESDGNVHDLDLGYTTVVRYQDK